MVKYKNRAGAEPIFIKIDLSFFISIKIKWK